MAEQASMFFAENPGVQPDPMGAKAQAYKMAQGISDYSQGQKVQNEGNQDQAILQAAMKDPDNDFNTPEGMEKALGKLQGKVTPQTYMNLKAKVDKTKEEHLAYTSKLMQMPLDQLNQHEQLADYVTKSEQGVMDAYDAAVKAKEADPNAPDPMQVYSTARQAKLQELSGVINPMTKQPLFSPDILKKVETMSPEDLKASIGTSKYHLDQITAAAKTRKEEAEAKAAEAHAGLYTKQAEHVDDKMPTGMSPVAKVKWEADNGLYGSKEDGSFDNTLYKADLKKAEHVGGASEANKVNIHSPEFETTAKKVASGEVPLNQLGRMSPGDRMALIARASAINPNFNAGTFSGVQKSINNFMAGKDGATVTSINTAVNHMNTVDKLIDALDNNDFKAFNMVANQANIQMGGKEVVDFEAAKKIVQDEVIKAVQGGAGGVAERKAAGDNLSMANSPDALHGVVDTERKLMAGRLGPLRLKFGQTTHLPMEQFDAMLTPAAREALQSSIPPEERAAGGGGNTPPAAAKPATPTAPKIKPWMEWKSLDQVKAALKRGDINAAEATTIMSRMGVPSASAAGAGK